MAEREPPSLGPLRPGGPARRPQQHATHPPQAPQNDMPRTLRTGQSRSAPARKSEKRRGGIGRFFIWGALGLVGLVVAGAAMLVLAPPSDFLRDQFAENFKKRTGRDLVISGPTSMTLFPQLALTMSDVTVSAKPGMGDTPTLRVREVDASVQLWPLLSRRVEVERLVLREPVVDMFVDAQGRKSWDFADAAPMLTERVRLAQASNPKVVPAEVRDAVQGGRRNPLARLEALALNEVKFVDGTLRYRDARSGVAEEVRNLNLEFGLESIASPLTTKGDLVWKGEKLTFTAQAAPLTALFEDQPATVNVALKSARIEAQYDGSIVMRGAAPELDGKIAAKVPAIKALMAWIGKPLPEATAIGAGAVNGRLKVANTSTSLSDATVALDTMALTGNLTVETAGVRPHLKGALRTGDLDLNRLLALASTGDGATTKPAAAKPAQIAPAAGPASIDDLLKQGGAAPAKAPQVRGFASRGWSDAPIALGGLGAVDADIKFSFARVLYRDIKTGAGNLTLALKNKVARVTAEELQLYDGRGKGLVTLDGSGAGVTLGTNLTFEGISTLPLLKDAASFDWLSGKGRLTVALGARGGSEAELIQSLNGKADLAMADGAINGINIPQVIRGVTQGRFSGLDRTPAEKTDFSDLAASWVITNGVAQNQDLRASSPLIRLSGAGSVNLPARTLDYVVRPKVVASLTGQGADAAGSGIEIPVRITGPFDKPSYKPDINAILKDPNQVIDAAKQIGKNLKGGDVEQAVKGLLGDGDPQQRKKARDALRGLLGR